MIKWFLRKWGVLPDTKPEAPPATFPQYLLRIEAGAVLLAALLFYFWYVPSTLFRAILFVVLILVPDFSLFAYAAGTKAGAIAYDLFHLYIFPAVVFGAGLYFNFPLARDVALIWIVHIAQDRLRGFGFKYFDSFYSSHVKKV